MTAPNDVLFWGCHRRAGHFLYGRGFRGVNHTGLLPASLQPHRLDAQLCPKDPEQRERRARLHHLDGWTVVAWWDRSVDTRMGSNSALLVRGTHTMADALLAGCHAFPELLPRFTGLELVP